MTFKNVIRFTFVVLAVSLPLLLLQFGNAFPALRPADPDMRFVGWPAFCGLMYIDLGNFDFGYLVLQSATSDSHRLNGFEFAQHLNSFITGVFIGLITHCILVNGAMKTLRFGILDIIAVTASFALLSWWFFVDSSVYIGNFDGMLIQTGTLGKLQTDRPLWQNVIAGAYILMASYSLFSALVYPFRKQPLSADSQPQHSRGH